MVQTLEDLEQGRRLVPSSRIEFPWEHHSDEVLPQVSCIVSDFRCAIFFYSRYQEHNEDEMDMWVTTVSSTEYPENDNFRSLAKFPATANPTEDVALMRYWFLDQLQVLDVLLKRYRLANAGAVEVFQGLIAGTI